MPTRASPPMKFLLVTSMLAPNAPSADESCPPSRPTLEGRACAAAAAVWPHGKRLPSRSLVRPRPSTEPIRYASRVLGSPAPRPPRPSADRIFRFKGWPQTASSQRGHLPSGTACTAATATSPALSAAALPIPTRSHSSDQENPDTRLAEQLQLPRSC